MISEHLKSFMHILEALGHQRTDTVTMTLIYLLRCSKCYQLAVILQHYSVNE